MLFALLFSLFAHAQPLPIERDTGVLRVGSTYEGKEYVGT